MSLRPRFGDGGLLRRPLELEGPAQGLVWSDGDVRGRFAPDRDWDPFERTSSGLLLAEDFARADLDDAGRAAGWYLEHGALDLQHVFPSDRWAGHELAPVAERFHDTRDEVLGQQRTVRWLLETLARLSQGPEAWEPGWMKVVLHSYGTLGVRLDIADGVLRFLPARLDAEDVPTGEARLWVPEERMRDHWTELLDYPALAGRVGRVPLTASYEGLVELVRQLLEPHVRIAAQFEVDLLWPEAEYSLVVSERRRWRSVLSPIYLQLLEGQRRVTEEQRGAGFCRECGQPYLTLDARRSSFCTDKDRFRFFQRQRRHRVAGERAARNAVARMQATGHEPPDAVIEDPQP